MLNLGKRWGTLDAFLLVVLLSMLKTAPIIDAAPSGQQPAGRGGACEDHVDHLCQEELRAHYCYLEHNRNLCCRTCQSLRTAYPDCPYGDHYTRIVRKGADGQNKTYTCDAYVKFYGQHHCRVDPQFRQYCCQSCRGA